MDRHSFIDTVYSKLTELFLSNVSEAKKESVRTAYLNFLHNNYDNYFLKAKDDELNGVAIMCAKREKITHLSIGEEAKNAFLFPDQVYLSLEELSFEIAEIAAKKKSGSDYKLRKQKIEYVELLQKLMNLVSDAFKYSAEKIYSESILDLEYIYSDNNNCSFRTTNSAIY